MCTVSDALLNFFIFLDSASKHATQAFFDTLKSELSHTDVHVLVVSPGYVNTNLSLNAVTGDGSKYGGKCNYSNFMIYQCPVSLFTTTIVEYFFFYFQSI